MEYKPTIGLEIHAELKTQTKMFCNSKNDPDEKEPNVNICPVCMAHPGTLPVINKAAVEHVLRVGTALGGELADFTEFDRKNYFYPDIPKGYQISQYQHPLVIGGSLNGVAITRVHLEEDTARSIHSSKGYSLIDFNRAGVPLMELVTEPDVGSAEEASSFARELQLLLRYLGASEANMEKGEMRVEANVSVSKDSSRGTKVEVKNLNSFKSVERAIAFEIKRQEKLLKRGEEVVQETRGWDEGKQQTFSQRLKEGSEDYRYFPDPDLPKLKISDIPEFSIRVLQKDMPELPWEKRDRFAKEFDIKNEDIEVFINNDTLGKLFEETIKILADNPKLTKLASNYITSDLVGMIKNFDAGEVVINDTSPNHFAELLKMIGSGEVSSRGAKDILLELFTKGGEPKKIADQKGLFQKSDEGGLRVLIEKIISDNKRVADDYCNGKESALQYLIGQAMKETGGSANPEVLKALFQKLLK